MMTRVVYKLIRILPSQFHYAMEVGNIVNDHNGYFLFKQTVCTAKEKMNVLIRKGDMKKVKIYNVSWL